MPATATPPADAGTEVVVSTKTALYEGMFVFDSADFATDGEEFTNRLVELIEKAGGRIEAHRMWQDGRLAFPIRNRRKGVHYIALFEMDPANVKTLDRTCKLEDKILRHLVIRPPEEIYHATAEVLNPTESADEDAEESPQIPD